MTIDTTFDFRTDARGKDPDSHSPMLRRYHQALWSKPLPNGELFDLDITTPGGYLHHRSSLGEFWLGSDSVIATFNGWISTAPTIGQFTTDEIAAFDTIGSTIGGTIVFPSNQIDRKMTINGARGFNRKISDRMDLTLECIRRHYLDEPNPLGETITRYADFFALFESFPGYVEYFLLQDLVTSDCTAVRFFMPFDNFTSPTVPRDVETYREFRRLSIEFVEARNRRIAEVAPHHNVRDFKGSNPRNLGRYG